MYNCFVVKAHLLRCQVKIENKFFEKTKQNPSKTKH